VLQNAIVKEEKTEKDVKEKTGTADKPDKTARDKKDGKGSIM